MVRKYQRLGRNVFCSILLLAIFSCTLFSGTAFCEEVTSQAIESVAEVGRACALGDDDAGAEAALSQLYSQYPTQLKVVPAIERVAQTFFSKKNIAKAQAIYSEAITKIPADHPNVVWLHKRVILCQIAQGDITGADQSIEAFKNDFSGNPKLSIVLLGLADDYLTYKKYDKAKDLWQYVSENTSDTSLSIKAKSEIVLCEIRLGNDSEADQKIAALMNDQSAAEELCNGLLALAKGCDKLKKFDKAKVLCQYVAQNSTDSSQVLTAKTWAVCMDIKSGNESTAAQAITALKTDYSDSQELCNSILIFAKDYQGKNQAKAIELYRYFAQNSTDSNKAIEAQKMAAVLGVMSGNETAADQAIGELKDNFSDHPQLCQNIHEIAKKCWFNKMFTKARELYYYVSENSSDKEMGLSSLSRALNCELKLNNQESLEQVLETLNAENSSVDDYIDKVVTICEVFVKSNDPAPALPHINLALQTVTDNEKVKLLLKAKVRCYMAMGADDQAKTIIDQIALDYSADKELPGILNGFADDYRKLGNYAKSIELHKQSLAKVTDGMDKRFALAGIAKAKARMQEATDSSDVDVIFQQMMTEKQNIGNLGYHIFQIGEEYYVKAHTADGSSQEQKNECHKKAIDVWKKNISEIDDPHHKCLAYYYTGLSYHSLKDYHGSLENFHKVINEYPKEKYAASALFMIGRIFQNSRGVRRIMMDPAAVFVGVADPNSVSPIQWQENTITISSTRAAFELLVEKYPDSSGADYARQWLSRQDSK